MGKHQTHPIKKTRTSTHVMQIIEECLYGDQIPTHTSNNEYELLLINAINHQKAIGYNHVRYGRITTALGDTQETYMKIKKKDLYFDKNNWERQICKATLEYSYRLWVQCNKALHDTTKGKK